jgi:hypothetical protein
MTNLDRDIAQGAARRLHRLETLSLDPRAAAEKFVLRYLTPLSAALPRGGDAASLVEMAARLRALRDLDAVFSMIVAAPRDDFLEGRWLDVNALLEPSPAGPSTWSGRRRIGGRFEGQAFAQWLERTAAEVAFADVRYVSGPAHVVAAMLNIVARLRAAALEPPCWTKLRTIQVSDCHGEGYAPLLTLHAAHRVRVVEAVRVPRLGIVAVSTPDDALVLLLDRGLVFELAAVDRSAWRIPPWESERGGEYELVVSSPADGLFEVETGVVLRCTSPCPLRFARLPARRVAHAALAAR